MKLRLADVERCLHGIIPSAIATADARGVPNVSYVSQVELVDDRHVALSCQFFNKTRQNVAENPQASLLVHDPITFSTYSLDLRYARSETEGPLYEAMKARLEAIATHTGMSGVFRLLSSDVYAVSDIHELPDFLEPQPTDEPPPLPEPGGPMGELRSLQLVSGRINGSGCLEELLETALVTLEEAFGFEHSMLLLVDETGRRLYALASHGYGHTDVGAEVAFGQGLIGKAAEERRVLRTMGMAADLRYGRAIKARAVALGQSAPQNEVPLPGLPDAQSQMAMPLLIGDRLVGVLAVESAHALRFEPWHETFLGLIGNQLALALDRFGTDERDGKDESLPPSVAPPSSVVRPEPLRLSYYPKDDTVFFAGEYLVRNLPGRILWKLLEEAQKSGRREFTNRELRLDDDLGLPAVKDNLESRLLLLRRRLEDKCPGLRLVPVRRGRFSLEHDGPLELVVAG